MNKNDEYIPVSDFKKGAEECLRNSERLLNDATALFYQNGSYTSCFVLTIFSIEEMAKASKLIDYHKKCDNNLPLTEWNIFTRSGSHKRKLQWMYAKDVEWISEITPSYEKLLKEIASEVKWARDLEEYNQKMDSI
jgi:AbiV family abortive infection protein